MIERTVDERRKILMKKASDIRSSEHLAAIMATFPEDQRDEIFEAIKPMLKLTSQAKTDVSS